MKTFNFALLIIISFLMLSEEAESFSPKGKTFGLGLMLGEPSGFSAKYWLQKDKALAFSVGNSYLGSLRIGMDYLWHFNAFESRVVNLYAGPGVAVGIGKSGGWWYKDKSSKWHKSEDDIGLGARGVLGINFVPSNSPIEIFGELGIMIGIAPGMYGNFEGAVGIRFYF